MVDRRAEIAFDCDLSSIKAARDFVEQTLLECGVADLIEVALLLTSELATNAVLHARTEYVLMVEVSSPEVLVEVSDRSPVAPVRKTRDPEEVGGRGIAIIDSLSVRWGFRPVDDGKAVWFVLASSARDT